MAFKKFIFLPTDYTFLFDKGASADVKKNCNPNFVKINGFSLDSDFNPRSCNVFEEFSVFGLSKEELISKLQDHCIIRSNGLINYNNYQAQLQLNSYEFSESFDFSDLVDFEG